MSRRRRGECLNTARLVNEVDRTATQRCKLVLDPATSRQEDDRNADLALTQRAQHVQPRHRWQGPVEQHEANAEALLHGVEKGLAIVELVHGEAAFSEVMSHDLAIEWVVVDQGDGSSGRSVIPPHDASARCMEPPAASEG